jgi:hypothetical protein
MKGIAKPTWLAQHYSSGGQDQWGARPFLSASI